MEDTLATDFYSLSLNAIDGTDSGESLKLTAKVKNKVMLILVDSGSSHSFVSSAFLSRCDITPVSMQPQLVKVANGETMVTKSVVKDMSWWIQGHTITANMRVLDLNAFDAILGYDWLKSHSPMNCHWENRTIEFEWQGKSVLLQGILPQPLQAQQLSVNSLGKLYSSNDIAALAVVEIFSPPEPQPIPSEVQTLLQQYSDVFKDPSPFLPLDFRIITFHLYQTQHQLTQDPTDILLCRRMR